MELVEFVPNKDPHKDEPEKYEEKTVANVPVCQVQHCIPPSQVTGYKSPVLRWPEL